MDNTLCACGAGDAAACTTAACTTAAAGAAAAKDGTGRSSSSSRQEGCSATAPALCSTVAAQWTGSAAADLLTMALKLQQLLLPLCHCCPRPPCASLLGVLLPMAPSALPSSSPSIKYAAAAKGAAVTTPPPSATQRGEGDRKVHRPTMGGTALLAPWFHVYVCQQEPERPWLDGYPQTKLHSARSTRHVTVAPSSISPRPLPRHARAQWFCHILLAVHQMRCRSGCACLLSRAWRSRCFDDGHRSLRTDLPLLEPNIKGLAVHPIDCTCDGALRVASER